MTTNSSPPNRATVSDSRPTCRKSSLACTDSSWTYSRWHEIVRLYSCSAAPSQPVRIWDYSLRCNRRVIRYYISSTLTSKRKSFMKKKSSSTGRSISTEQDIFVGEIYKTYIFIYENETFFKNWKTQLHLSLSFLMPHNVSTISRKAFEICVTLNTMQLNLHRICT